ncbi:MAG: phosphotriesterase [Variibacter sp.]
MTDLDALFQRPAAPPIGVTSGHVMTVLGPLPVARMGITLPHEHILLDGSKKWRPACNCGQVADLAERPLSMDILGELRVAPVANRDNCMLDDVDLAVEELAKFKTLGGETIVDATSAGIGRDPKALQDISRRTGLNIVMGCGFYLSPAHPASVATKSIDELADEMVYEVGGMETRPRVLAGLIGEIGVSPEFVPDEEKCLRAAARASARTKVPLSIHLPGWERYGERVLDIVEEEGADLAHAILCHMNPSHEDLPYQRRLAARGAFLEYDMIGIDFYFGEKQVQSPSDEQNARAICRLIEDGFLDRLLLSHDVFLKMMLMKYGGFGYGHILKNFVPRLRTHGLGERQLRTLLVDNPRRVFSAETVASPAAAH